MPITDGLKNVKRFESVGFTHEQAETLAKTIEEAVTVSQADLKNFISNELLKQTEYFESKFNALQKDFDGKFATQQKDFDSKLNGLEARLMASQKDLLIKVFGIIVGTVGIAVAIIKLF